MYRTVCLNGYFLTRPVAHTESYRKASPSHESGALFVVSRIGVVGIAKSVYWLKQIKRQNRTKVENTVEERLFY